MSFIVPRFPRQRRQFMATYRPSRSNTAADIQTELDQQLTQSVRWTESMRAIIAAGAQTFIEIGSGTVLAGLMRRIDRSKSARQSQFSSVVGGFPGVADLSRLDKGDPYHVRPYSRAHRSEQVFEVILNRPTERNAINDEMMMAISRAFDQAEREFNEGARVVLVRGAGRVFSSGIDLNQFLALDEGLRANLFPFTARYQAVFDKIERCSLPVICVLQGYCLGMALELALACDFRIAAERTKLGLPEARLGIIPDVGGAVRLVKLVGPSRAKDLIMTGRNIDLSQALEWGLVNAVVAQGGLGSRRRRFCGGARSLGASGCELRQTRRQRHCR